MPRRPLPRAAMPVPRVLRIAATELAFAGGLVALIAGGVALVQQTAPAQLHALCVSTQAMATAWPVLHWNCDASADGAPPGQPMNR